MSIKRFKLWRGILFGLLLLALLWASWYVYDKGFGRRWRITLAREFKRFGLVINVRRLTLDPFRGLIASDVQIFNSESRQTMLAEISNISLDINYSNLLQHEPALNAVDLQDARILLPINPSNPKAGYVELKRLHARIYFLPGRIEIHQVLGDLYGIQLTGSGTLVHPAQYSWISSQNSSNPGQSPNGIFLREILEELRNLRFGTKRPRLDLAFQVDMAKPKSFRIQNGVLTAPVFYRHSYEMHDLQLNFSLEDQRIIVQRLHLADSQGEAYASGNWSLASGHKNFQVRSTMNVAKLLGPDPRCPWANDWAFDAAPQIELAGQERRDGSVRFIGKLAFDRFSYRSVPFQGMTATFSKDGSSWMILDANVTHKTGTLSGDALRDTRQFRLRIHSALDPVAISSLFPQEIQKALASCEFETPPVLQANFAGRSEELKDLEGTGQIWLGRTRLRGATFNSASAAFQLKNQILAYNNFRIARDEGAGTGSFTYNPLTDDLRIEEFKANLYPGALAAWVSSGLTRVLQPFHFNIPPAISASGNVHIDNKTDNDLEIDIQADHPFTYELPGLLLPFDSAKTHLSLQPDRIQMTDFRGRIAGGTWSMQSSARLPLAKNSYHSTIGLQGIDLSSFNRTRSMLQGIGGRLDGDVSVRYRLGNATELSLDGNVRIGKANLKDSSLFGPLLPHLAALGFAEAPELTLQFGLDRELLRFRSIRLVSGSHTLDLNGYIGLFGAPIDLEGKSETSRLRAIGSIEHPDWQISAQDQP